jgi:hypothetical protein
LHLLSKMPSNDVGFFNTFFYSCRYESCIDAEIQQRAVEYIALSRKGAALMDILAEMPKFPERQVLLV